MPAFTKNAIIESFIRLLNDKPLDKIRIKDIVEDCGINRNTFYYHFEDIASLVVYIFNTETERVLSEHYDIDSFEEGFIDAAKFALDNKKAVYHIYNSVNREELERYLNIAARDVLTRYVKKLLENITVQASDQELIINFYKCALVGLVLDWISNGMKDDPEVLIRRLGMLIEGNMLTSLKRSCNSKP